MQVHICICVWICTCVQSCVYKCVNECIHTNSFLFCVSRRFANGSGTGTSHDHLDWPRLSYREQFKEGDEEADRGNDGKTTSKSGLALNGMYFYGKPRTGRSAGSWL